MALFPFGILSAAGAGVVAGDYELIETQILGSATSSITFSNLGLYAATYKHLQIRATTRTTESAAESAVRIRFNSDTGANYAWHFLFGNGSTVSPSADVSQTAIYPFASVGNTQTANGFGVFVIDILDYSSTTKNKTTRAFTGYASGTNRIALASGLWQNTSAITSVFFGPNTSNWATGSRFSIYGIRG